MQCWIWGACPHEVGGKTSTDDRWKHVDCSYPASLHDSDVAWLQSHSFRPVTHRAASEMAVPTAQLLRHEDPRPSTAAGELRVTIRPFVAEYIASRTRLRVRGLAGVTTLRHVFRTFHMLAHVWRETWTAQRRTAAQLGRKRKAFPGLVSRARSKRWRIGDAWLEGGTKEQDDISTGME